METILVLGVAALILLGGFVIFTVIDTRIEASNFSRALKTFDADIREMANVTNRNVGLNNASATAIQTSFLKEKTQNYAGFIITNAASANIFTKYQNAAISRNVAGSIFNNSSGVLGYEINLNTIPKNICRALVSSDFISQVVGVNIAGITIINRANVRNQDISNVANISTTYGDFLNKALVACSSSNRVSFSYFNFYDTVLAPKTILNSQTQKTEWQFKPTISNKQFIDDPASCTGGSTYNGSFCACPVSTEWNGSMCLPYGAKPGWCAPGSNWNKSTQTCQATTKYAGKNVTTASTVFNNEVLFRKDPVTNEIIELEYQNVAGNNLSATKDAVSGEVNWSNPVNNLSQTATTVHDGYYADFASATNNSDSRIATQFNLDAGRTNSSYGKLTPTDTKEYHSFYDSQLFTNNTPGQACTGTLITGYDKTTGQTIGTVVTGVFNGTFCELPSNGTLTTVTNGYRAEKTN